MQSSNDDLCHISSKQGEPFREAMNSQPNWYIREQQIESLMDKHPIPGVKVPVRSIWHNITMAQLIQSSYIVNTITHPVETEIRDKNGILG